ncbi:hypothetical protein FOQG_03452 [Fusarium oxysporum f. sp. raphani 54005]|uniref:Uncharacterized protein n=1 Tax=Fusarium oxysporum f. sp. raphani 54005 TaxID=1089458 RepID=X0CPM5_FUSOX|nr:hypothetical protein FOQG_03452 [Fusarium oxysporum f. sp. raphani 54005]
MVVEWLWYRRECPVRVSRYPWVESSWELRNLFHSHGVKNPQRCSEVKNEDYSELMCKKRVCWALLGLFGRVWILVMGDDRECFGGGRDEKQNSAGSGGQEPYPYLRVRLAPSNPKTTSAA